jgi:hypothetical protein
MPIVSAITGWSTSRLRLKPCAPNTITIGVFSPAHRERRFRRPKIHVLRTMTIRRCGCATRRQAASCFAVPCPALTHIWISPDSEYVIGISNVMLRNPYQLVVFNRAGDRLLERNMVGVNWPGVSRSVTNWIHWYKEPAPQMKIVKEGATATLFIEDRLGVLREFQFPSVR